MTRPKIFLLTLISLAGLFLAACENAAPEALGTPTAALARPAPTLIIPTLAESPLSAYYIPPYYSPEYLELVNASKNETELVIYSEFSRDQWRSVIQAFNSHYPWIKVKLIVPETTNAFDQYDNDVTLAVPTADMIISTDTVAWYKFFLRGEIEAYQSQESLYLPLWATKNSGLYPMSLDPAVIVYYQGLLKTPPTNMLALSNIIRRSPESYIRKVATLDATLDTEAFLANWFWIKAKGKDGWELLGKISEIQPVISSDKDQLVQSIIRGSVRVGYFIPVSAVLAQSTSYPNLKYSFITDGQPIFVNYVGITNVAPHPNSAKLLLDFLLSQDGQLALAEDRMMPYRSDVASVLDFHLEVMEKTLGAEKLIFLDIDTALTKAETVSNFLEKWRATYGRLPASQ